MAPRTLTLYHYDYSICSLMVRYTYALRGEPKDEASDIILTERHVDLFRSEQLTEDFLRNINPKGQVPVLVGDGLDNPLADSLEITHYLATLYPNLIPGSQKAEITKLLGDLHALNFFSLSYAGRHVVTQGFEAAIRSRMDGNISPQYQTALEYKLKVTQSEKTAGLATNVVESMVERAKALMHTFTNLLQPATEDQANGATAAPWLFGLSRPTALDAHLVTFIGRMLDVNRKDLIPNRLMKYAEDAWAGSEWQRVMQGRPTHLGG
ncbi:uncharacterized protein Z518_06778 [Rhinocladiella mackenziei CBS 650.93]|uniref:GST N-terminal domain-containing protein n=1 Tax=Rhinocladiella mackenziei CBS 650.93 TaxID=1442369 RepID=A0A0D2IIV5_9EURO|nr:uncharacterized protein Z518_06778 [Rhinocladiella mackenziei CBS 650.93]KIX03226.1 hypothetical protein Z518_06778 [Rhinocladiella mackenziei CBS 650.93]